MRRGRRSRDAVAGGRWQGRGRLPEAPSVPGQGQLEGVDQPSLDSGSPKTLCSVLPGGHVGPAPPWSPGSRGPCSSPSGGLHGLSNLTGNLVTVQQA